VGRKRQRCRGLVKELETHSVKEKEIKMTLTRAGGQREEQQKKAEGLRTLGEKRKIVAAGIVWGMGGDYRLRHRGGEKKVEGG